MIIKPINIESRKPLWIALSALYLDTELQEAELAHIRETVEQSGYSLPKIERIIAYELHPVLKYNLVSVAGEWSGFDEEWLVAKASSQLCNKRSLLTELRIKFRLGSLGIILEELERALRRN